jgi:hypothetical protein
LSERPQYKINKIKLSISMIAVTPIPRFVVMTGKPLDLHVQCPRFGGCRDLGT